MNGELVTLAEARELVKAAGLHVVDITEYPYMGYDWAITLPVEATTNGNPVVWRDGPILLRAVMRYKGSVVRCYFKRAALDKVLGRDYPTLHRECWRVAYGDGEAWRTRLWVGDNPDPVGLEYIHYGEVFESALFGADVRDDVDRIMDLEYDQRWLALYKMARRAGRV